MTRRLSGIHAAWHFWFAVSFGGEGGLRKVGLCGIHPLTQRYIFIRGKRYMERTLILFCLLFSSLSLASSTNNALEFKEYLATEIEAKELKKVGLHMLTLWEQQHDIYIKQKKFVSSELEVAIDLMVNIVNAERCLTEVQKHYSSEPLLKSKYFNSIDLAFEYRKADGYLWNLVREHQDVVFSRIEKERCKDILSVSEIENITKR
ncbi:DUF3265 domain-containing protein [Vibrio vulnificus]|nr:DUF3265 domain-containing protein [Vibrio vulnificus]EJE8558825.1 DUF3265 domain-containing protein [Vibrio vulnificus]